MPGFGSGTRLTDIALVQEQLILAGRMLETKLYEVLERFPPGDEYTRRDIEALVAEYGELTFHEVVQKYFQGEDTDPLLSDMLNWQFQGPNPFWTVYEIYNHLQPERA